jgi:general secretion pathway protein G
LSHRGIVSPAFLHAARAAGFTLLKVLVVVIIIGMLTSYFALRLFAQISKPESRLAQAQINDLENTVPQYRLDAGPYLAKGLPLDPWRKPYAYQSPGGHGDVDLFSYGKDGRPVGSGDAADVTNG